MSTRGRGRGRGGRGGGAPTSQARLLLQRSAAEAGTDERSAISMMRPPHYPDMLWHSSGRLLTPEEEAAFRNAETQKKKPALQFTKRSTAMAYLVRKQRHLSEYIQGSPQYIQHVPPHLDIARYQESGKSDGGSPDRPDIVVREAMGKLATNEHLPEELLQGISSNARQRNRKRRRNPDGSLIDLEEFEKKERRSGRGGAGVDGNSDEDSEDDDDLDVAPEDLDDEEEEEDNQDYTTNYYESEDDTDGGGDGGEATF